MKNKNVDQFTEEFCAYLGKYHNQRQYTDNPQTPEFLREICTHIPVWMNDKPARIFTDQAAPNEATICTDDDHILETASWPYVIWCIVHQDRHLYFPQGENHE